MIKKTAFLLFIGCIIGLSSCGEDKKTKYEERPQTGIESHFVYFPLQQFESIYLNQELSEAEEYLTTRGYLKTDTQLRHYKNPQEKIEVVLSGKEKTTAIKLFFLDSADIDEEKRLKELLGLQAIEQTTSPEFSYYRFKTGLANFSVSLFAQADLLRLNIELKEAH
ncbi:MAG: hypothetical protein WDZ35_09520 [Crocinitomicaceae bacterium]